jgi:hypothetical protein
MAVGRIKQGSLAARRTVAAYRGRGGCGNGRKTTTSLLDWTDEEAAMRRCRTEGEWEKTRQVGERVAAAVAVAGPGRLLLGRCGDWTVPTGPRCICYGHPPKGRACVCASACAKCRSSLFLPQVEVPPVVRRLVCFFYFYFQKRISLFFISKLLVCF